MSLRIRRGTDAERQGLTFDLGEIVWTTDTRELWVGDGVTQGGVNPAASLAGTNLVFNTETNKLDVTNLTTDGITEGQNNRYFSSELAQAATANLFQNGTHTGITFVYDDSQNKINATVTVTGSGTFNLLDDTTPELGGNLGLNNKNITGTGNIDIIGNISTTGTIYPTGGLGGNLSLNGKNIIGTGNIQTTGTIWATQGLGGNLDLNNYDITGLGNIDIDGLLTIGTILATEGLAGTLYLNTHNIEGTGDIIVTGNITASGDVSGNLVGTLTGEVVGSLTGNVFASNGSTLIVNADTNTVGTSDTLFTGKGIDTGSASTEIISTNSTALNVLGTTSSEIRLTARRFDGANPIATLPGDTLGSLGVNGFDGTGYKTAAAMVGSWDNDATLSDEFPKSKMILAVSAGGSNVVIATLNSAGVLSAPVVKTGQYNGSLNYPSPAEAGMIILDSSNNQFYGYNGASWVVLG